MLTTFTPEMFVAILSVLGTLIYAVTAIYVQVHQLRQQVDGRLDQLLELTRRSALAEGQLSRQTPPPAGAEPPPLA